MKKLVKVMALGTLVPSFVLGSYNFAMADAGIRVTVNGQYVMNGNSYEKNYDYLKAELIDGKSMFPLSSLANALGCSVAYNAESKSINLAKDASEVISMKAGERNIGVYSRNGSQLISTYTCKVVPQNINGKTYISATDLAEVLEAKVTWNAEAKTVEITSGDDGTCGKNAKWTLTDNGKTLKISGYGDLYDYELSSSYVSREQPWMDSYSGTGKFLSAEDHTITSVNIGEGITGIGDDTFEDLKALQRISLPSTLKKIGISAFRGCKNLTEIEIPAAVTSIGIDAFGGCNSLRKIDVAEGNTYVASKNGILYNASKTKLLVCPEGMTGNIDIPNGVATIREYAFSCCYNLTGVTIPNSVTNIEKGTFDYCSSLTDISLPNSIATIGESTFDSCESLKRITIPSSVTSISKNAFKYCYSLSEVHCKKGSCADNKALYPDSNVTFVYD